MKTFSLFALLMSMVTLACMGEQSTNSVVGVPIIPESLKTMTWLQWILLILANLSSFLLNLFRRDSLNQPD